MTNADYPQIDEASTPNTPTRGKKGGCAGCLVLVLGLILFCYIIVFQTSIPLKLITNSIVKDNQVDGRPLVIQGVGGSLSRGISIRKLVIPGTAGDTTIINLKLKYKKPMRWFTRGQFTFTEISSESAEFVVANDFFKSNEDDNTGEAEKPENDSVSKGDSAFSEEGFLDLQLLQFKNTHIRTVDGSVDVKIPLIYLKGLYADRNDFHIEDLKVQSNVLSVSLAEGKTAEIDGRKVKFGQQINLAFKPAIHPTVIKEIPLTLSFNNEEGKTTAYVTAFDGALQQADLADKSSFLHLAAFSPEKYFHFDNQVIPGDIKVIAREKDDMVDLEAGSFTIGRTTFHFPAQVLDDTHDNAVLPATGTAGPYEVTAVIKPDRSSNAWPPVLMELSSKPEAPKNEILSQLYFGRDYGTLSDDEKVRIDKFE